MVRVIIKEQTIKEGKWEMHNRKDTGAYSCLLPAWRENSASRRFGSGPEIPFLSKARKFSRMLTPPGTGRR